MNGLPGRVRNVLQGLHLEDPDITVEDAGASIFATVVSGSFTGVDEADRQQQVWDALRGRLSPEDVVSVEFVFTLAPNELSDNAEETG